MAKKYRRLILLYSLLLCSGLYLFVQCVKDDSFSGAQIEQARQAEELIAENVNHGSSGIFTLPVNLHKYNRNPQTKGAQTDTTYNIVVDSLIDHTKGRTQLFDNGWMYYQVPFKSNEVGIYAAITPKSGKFTDSLVTIKCFYLLVDNYIEPQPMRYSVTMIPTHSYHKQNPDYDFLDKPSFSGYILYSLIDGTFVRSEAYKDGVIRDVTLKLKFETATQTKARDGGSGDGSSDSEDDDIVVYGGALDGKDQRCLADKNSSGGYNQNFVIEFDRKDLDFANGHGGGGNPDTRSTETQHTVTCVIDLCSGKKVNSASYSKGSKFSYTAPEGSDTCKFICWVGESSVSSRKIEFTVTQDVTVTAKYTSPTKNSACYKLMEFLGIDGRMQMINGLIKIYDKKNEFAFIVDNKGNVSTITGVDGEVDLTKLNLYKRYCCISHSHNKEHICVPSFKDIAFLICHVDLFKSPESAVFDILGGNTELDEFFLFSLQVVNLKKVLAPLEDFTKLKNNPYKSYLEYMQDRLFREIERAMAWYRIRNGKMDIPENDKLSILSPILKKYGLAYNLIDIKRQPDNNLQINWNENDPTVSSKIKKESKNCFTQILNK